MKKDIVYKLTENFEDFLHKTEDGVEFWLARDLQHLLGYGKWDNFQNVISKAKTACEISGQDIADHFADVGKMVEIGSGAQKEIDEMLKKTPNDHTLWILKGDIEYEKKKYGNAKKYFQKGFL